MSIVDTFQTPKISSQHESFAKLMLIWHVHKGSQQPSRRSVGRICISSIPYHSPFLEPILCLVLQQNNWRQQSMMLFKWGIMHKPSPSWGGVLSGQDTALSSNIMSWLWSASDDGRRRVSSETDSMAHPLSTVLAHYRSPSWQRRRRPDNHWTVDALMSKNAFQLADQSLAQWHPRNAKQMPNLQLFPSLQSETNVVLSRVLFFIWSSLHLAVHSAADNSGHARQWVP